jgi:hypothetical protein
MTARVRTVVSILGTAKVALLMGRCWSNRGCHILSDGEEEKTIFGFIRERGLLAKNENQISLDSKERFIAFTYPRSARSGNRHKEALCGAGGGTEDPPTPVPKATPKEGHAPGAESNGFFTTFVPAFGWSYSFYMLLQPNYLYPA